MGSRATSVIWRSVVFAGAMLAAPGCKKDAPASNTTPEPPEPAAAVCDDPCMEEDPCNPGTCRPRGGGEEPEGRGFVLS